MYYFPGELSFLPPGELIKILFQFSNSSSHFNVYLSMSALKFFSMTTFSFSRLLIGWFSYSHTIASILFFFHNFFFLKIFNWRIIALQCCAGFCQQQCESAASIHYVPSLLNRPSIPPHLTFLGYHRAPG